MKINKCIFIIIIIAAIFMAATAFCAESDGWIKSEKCWVVKTPSGKGKIIGIIKRKAAVTVEDAGDEWLKIVFAPVRDINNTGKWLECKGCYIQKSSFTTVFPRK